MLLKKYLLLLIKVNDQIYQVDLERDTTIHDAESTESSADICFEAIKAEYDYCVTRAEKLENKVYILLAACAFVFALLTTQIEKAGKLDVPQSGSELLGIIIYTILLVVAVISNVGMLVMTVSLLKSVRFERMKSFRIKNIKSFKDSGKIEIKPITIFVGKNSCGKSSLLRFPIVLAQTATYNTDSPIMFYGKMLDYGNYEDVVFGGNKENIEFAIHYDIDINDLQDARYRVEEEMMTSNTEEIKV